MNRKYFLALAVLLVPCLSALGYFWPFGRTNNELKLPGIVEIQEVRLASKVGGRVAKLHVLEGDMVEPGQPLVTFEVPELEKQLEQQSAAVEMLKQEWIKAKEGNRPEEIAQARAAADTAGLDLVRVAAGWREEEKRQAASELESAEADCKQAQLEFERISRLAGQKASSDAELLAAYALRDRTKGRLGSAKARHDMLQAGSRKEDIDVAWAKWQESVAHFVLLVAGSRKEDILIAEARYKQAEAKLAEMKINYHERTIYATGKALVEVIAVRPGDVVAPNQPVVRVLRAEDLWLKVYVPETEVSKVTLGKKVDVRIDAYPDRVFQGTVIQIASISEFTPRNVQSADERRYQVFAVKVRVDNPRGVFKSGLAAEVVLPLEGPP
jgi:HlyD family secretion protein